MTRKLVLATAILLFVAAGLAAAQALRNLEEGDVRGSSTEEFVTTGEEEAVVVPEAPPLPGVLWPTYGFSNTRTRAVGYDHTALGAHPTRQLGNALGERRAVADEDQADH